MKMCWEVNYFRGLSNIESMLFSSNPLVKDAAEGDLKQRSGKLLLKHLYHQGSHLQSVAYQKCETYRQVVTVSRLGRVIDSEKEKSVVVPL